MSNVLMDNKQVISLQEMRKSKYINLTMAESMQKCIELSKKYPTFDATLTLLRNQSKMRIESYAISSTLALLSYIYCHSNEVKAEWEVNSMPLNLYVALFGDTGYCKTTYMNLSNYIIEIIINSIKNSFEGDDILEEFNTAFPASRSGMQREFREFPVRPYLIDEAQDILLSKDDHKRDSFDLARNMFNTVKFKSSATKNKENENMASHDRCLAVLIIAGTPDKMSLGLLSDERMSDGSANRFLIIAPSSYREESRCYEKLEDAELKIINQTIKNCTKAQVKYAREVITTNSMSNTGKQVQYYKENKFTRIIKHIYSEKIEVYFDKIEADIAKILDEYEKKKMSKSSEIFQITRTGVIKKRLAYILWLEKELHPNYELECAEDAAFIIDALYKTAEDRGIFELENLDGQKIIHKILSLEEKYPKGNAIAVKPLTGKKKLLDIHKHGNSLKKIIDNMDYLEKIGKIKTLKDKGTIISFRFNED